VTDHSSLPLHRLPLRPRQSDLTILLFHVADGSYRPRNDPCDQCGHRTKTRPYGCDCDGRILRSDLHWEGAKIRPVRRRNRLPPSRSWNRPWSQTRESGRPWNRLRTHRTTEPFRDQRAFLLHELICYLRRELHHGSGDPQRRGIHEAPNNKGACGLHTERASTFGGWGQEHHRPFRLLRCLGGASRGGIQEHDRRIGNDQHTRILGKDAGRAPLPVPEGLRRNTASAMNCPQLICGHWSSLTSLLVDRLHPGTFGDRHLGRSTIVTSQFFLENWHEAIGDPTLADAVPGRSVHNAHRIALGGESLRKSPSALTHIQDREKHYRGHETCPLPGEFTLVSGEVNSYEIIRAGICCHSLREVQCPT
jgi:hypothetical protein